MTVAAVLVSGWLALPGAGVARAQRPGGNIFNDPPPDTAKPPRRPDAGQAPPTVAVPRVPVPPESDVTAARKAARAKYASYYAEKKPAIQASLVKKLTEDAQAPAAKPAERYALLREAAEVSAAAGDIAGAMSAVAEVARRFEADEAEVTVAVMSASQRGITKETAAQWAERAMKIADAAGDAGKYDLCGKALAVADAAAKVMGAAGASVATSVKQRTASIRDLRAEEGKLKVVFEKLKTSPDDPDSNLKAGKFYCLVANDWVKGLAALSKCAQLEMKALAEMETAGLRDEKAGKAIDGNTRQKLGDAWWELAAREREPYASKAKLRAVHHYRKAMEMAKDAAAKDRLWDRIASMRKPVDLMAGVDVKRDSVRGGAWGWRGRELAVQSRDQHGLGFGYTPAKEYDFLLEYTVLSSETYAYVRQCIPAPRNGSAAWVMQSERNYFAGSSPTSVPTAKVGTGGLSRGRHASLIRVRKDSIRVYLDNQLVLEWEADPQRMSGQAAAGYPTGLGVGAYGVTVVFHTARIVEAPDAPQAAADAGKGAVPQKQQ